MLFKTKKQKEKEKTKKLFINYIYLLIIFAITITAVLGIRNWYLNKKEYELSIPVIRDALLHEVNENELINYINENPDTVLYMCAASDTSCREFETEFKELIKEKSLESTITYLNLSNLDTNEKIKDFFDYFNDTFQYERIVNDYPALILYKNGEIVQIANGTEDEKLTVNQARYFIERYNIEKED